MFDKRSNELPWRRPSRVLIDHPSRIGGWVMDVRIGRECANFFLGIAMFRDFEGSFSVRLSDEFRDKKRIPQGVTMQVARAFEA